jgi:hypothetical protein
VSRSRVSLRGRTEAIASAAEAPQIATAPPERTPNIGDKPSRRASRNPNTIVVVTPTITVATGQAPSEAIWPSVMRTPSRPTPTRNTERDVNSMPATHRPSSCRKWNAIPNRSANSITGAV